MSVLVFGATGNLGRPLMKELAKLEIEAVGVSRSPSRNSDESLRLLGLDVADSAALRSAVEAFERVVIIGANTIDQIATESAIIDAAAAAASRQIIKISVSGAADDAPMALGRDHFAIEEHLFASGLPATIVRPGFFMQNLLGYASWIDSDGSWRLPMGEAPIAMVHTGDVAEAIAVTLDDSHIGADYQLTGTDPIDLAAAAKALGDASVRNIKYLDGNGEQFLERLLQDGLQERYARDLVILYDIVIRAGYLAEPSQDLPALLGEPATSFTSFAHEYAHRFTLSPRASSR
jgi:NAD(P)H dehydrogenase (quinone)